MKKLLAVLLAAMMIFTFAACSDKGTGDGNDLDDYQQDDVVIDHIDFENGDTFYFDSVDSETVTITKYEGSDLPHALVIPETLNEKTVVAISDSAFYACSRITSVTFPETVTSIGSFAFAGCVALETLSIPANIKTIGVGAFQGCVALKTLTFAQESELSNIEQHTFNGCSALEAVTIPGYIDTIGTAAFFNCESLASITIAEGVSVIGAQSFQNCTALKTLKLPASAASIGQMAFSGSDNLYLDGVDCPENSKAEEYIGSMNLGETAPAEEE